LAITIKKILIALVIGVFLMIMMLVAIVGWALYSASDKENSRAYEAKEAEGREFGKTDRPTGLHERRTRACEGPQPAP
jgi:Tfp pilus assembly protein PilO